MSFSYAVGVVAHWPLDDGPAGMGIVREVIAHHDGTLSGDPGWTQACP